VRTGADAAAQPPPSGRHCAREPPTDYPPIEPEYSTRLAAGPAGAAAPAPAGARRKTGANTAMALLQRARRQSGKNGQGEPGSARGRIA